MASSRDPVDVTPDELERLQAALQSQNFRGLLLDYVREVNDPTNRAVYEAHVKSTERERGYDVTFVHPDPGYVLKTTSIKGGGIVLRPNAGRATVPAFINLAASVCVDKPSCKRISNDDGGQVFWTVPHTFSPPRTIDDNGVVYDCVFHPDTLQLAASNGCFKEMIEELAIDGIEFNFEVKLTRNNVELDQSCRYKGPSIATIIRRPLSSNSTRASAVAIATGDSPVIVDKVQVPENNIKYRHHLDMQDFAIGVKDPSSGRLDVADEIVVEIQLPLVKSSSEVHLDVQTNELFLKSVESHAASHSYSLELKLPCAVREDDGRAQFDSERKILTVVLPTYACEVRRKSSTDKAPVQIVANDVDDMISTRLEAMTVKDDIEPTKVIQSASKHFLLPDFTCHQDDQEIVFVLKTEKVCRDSVHMDHLHDGMACQINYSTVGGGCVPFDYALFVRFPCPCRVEPAGTTITVNDDSVVVIFKKSFTSRTNWNGYFYDTDGTHELKEATIQVSSLQESLNALWNDSKKVADIATKPLPVAITEVNSERIVIEFPGDKELVIREESKDETKCSAAAVTEQDLLDKLKECKFRSPDFPNCMMRPRKFRSVSESSADTTGASARRMLRGILKYPRCVRTLSESSDDYSWSSADYATMDSDIPEEEEGSESAGNGESGGRKKSVHFNNNITKTLFRINSSILGQRKKKQRRRQRKRDVEQQRRASESECSEGESAVSTPPQKPIGAKNNGCIVGNRHRNMPNANCHANRNANDSSTGAKVLNDNEIERKRNENNNITSTGGGRQQMDKNGNGIRQNGRKQTSRRDNKGQGVKEIKKTKFHRQPD